MTEGVLTDKASKWARTTSYGDRALFQDLANDLRRFEATRRAEGGPEGGQEGPEDRVEPAQAEPAQAEAAQAPSQPRDSQRFPDPYGASGRSAADLGRTGFTQSFPAQTGGAAYSGSFRPASYSACPTYWAYTRQKALGATTAPSERAARERAPRATQSVIGTRPRFTLPPCESGARRLCRSAAGDKTATRSMGPSDITTAALGPDRMTSSEASAVKRGYIYVPPRMRGSTAPKPFYTKAQLSQTSFIPSVDMAADTIWRKRWDYTSAQNDYTLRRKANHGVGPMASVYYSQADSGARYTRTYNSTAREFEGGENEYAAEPRYVPKAAPDAPRPDTFTSPMATTYIKQSTFDKTASLRYGPEASGRVYTRRLSSDPVDDSIIRGKMLKYDTRTEMRSSYRAPGDYAKEAARADREEAHATWQALFTKPCPVPLGVPAPMETTLQAQNKLVVMANEQERRRCDELAKASLQREVDSVFTSPAAKDWAAGLPTERARQLESYIREIKMTPDKQ